MHIRIKKYIISAIVATVLFLRFEQFTFADKESQVGSSQQDHIVVNVEIRNPSKLEKSLKEGDRVDVMLRYTNDGIKGVQSIAEFVKVVSVDASINKADIEVLKLSVLGTEDLKRNLALVNTWGSIYLQEGYKSMCYARKGADGNTFHDMREGENIIAYPLKKYEKKSPSNSESSFLYSKDPISGKQIRYILKKSKWRLDKSYLP